MSCRCKKEQWQRDYEHQRGLAKKAAILLERPQILYRTPDGRYCFASEGEPFEGEQIEILTQY